MTRAPALFALIGAMALSGCATTDLTGVTAADNNNTNRNAGAIAGAATGAIAGVVLGDRNPAIVATATVAGAILGAGVGEALDRQAAALRRDIGNDQVTVTNTGDRLLVNFPQDILFATDSASVGTASRDALGGLARNLKQYPDNTVEVLGHTDNTGSAAHNFDLSSRRAGSVAAILVADGVPGSRITATGRGAEQPVASNLTQEGRARNRRVEVVIRPTG